jgi:hypothetical protein
MDDEQTDCVIDGCFILFILGALVALFAWAGCQIPTVEDSNNAD